MLSNDYFYYGITRKYIIIFGSLFNNLIINRDDNSGNVTQIINVPISYASKEKMLTRVVSDPSIQRQDAIILPRMSFEVMNVAYAADRKLNTMSNYGSGLSNTSVTSTYTPVPYDVFVNLYIYVKNNEDGTKIVEQILPFFTPDFTIKADMIPGLPSLDVPIILNSVRLEDTNTADTVIKDTRVLVWNLSFTIKGNFYGPQRISPVINFANVSISTGSGPARIDQLWDFGLEDLGEDTDG